MKKLVEETSLEEVPQKEIDLVIRQKDIWRMMWVLYKTQGYTHELTKEELEEKGRLFGWTL